MSISTIGLSEAPNVVSSYVKNVGAAARAFGKALFAVTPRKGVATVESVKAVSGKPVTDQLSLYRLYLLASKSSSYDSVSPALAQELRLIAARG